MCDEILKQTLSQAESAARSASISGLIGGGQKFQHREQTVDEFLTEQQNDLIRRLESMRKKREAYAQAGLLNKPISFLNLYSDGPF